MKKVRDGLYIGDLADASAVVSGLYPENITHLLSLLSLKVMPPAAAAVDSNPSVSGHEFSSGSFVSNSSSENQFCFGSSGDFSGDEGCKSEAKLVRKSMPLSDMETENLLEHLEECLAFVEEGVKSGAILVHCLAGVSRSAAVVLAYIMKVERLSLDDALISLRKASDKVCPNAGFMNQLRLFQMMDYKIDKRNSLYKGFLLQMLGEDYMMGERIEWSRFAADPESATDFLPKVEISDSGLVDNIQERHVSFYRCKKCRRILASQENVLNHSPGVGQEAFKWRKRGQSSKDEMSATQCSSIFVEPMRWMKTVRDCVVEGKLLCVKCDARLGSFNWAGLQCSCGAWVNPAFQLHKSRIDEA
ncbi:hypothetical protein O6H91_18G062500 [Diphasiastrum complanatum]|uniref:Uncharacterized protein n=1 Tax=Diphasiastrum complanatum TaxID=34168 RepID=A0ACC2B224_DIPCM|nr:hypothetical protein O6H91_18G062500 [Diphasiastrum complanatum]